VTYTIRCTETIREIPREDWDDLAGDNILVSHAWLRTIEESSTFDSRPTYLLIEEAGRIVAGSVCERLDRHNALFSLDKMMFGRLAPAANRAGISFLPALECGHSWSYGSHFLIRSGTDPEESMELMERLLGFVENLAVKENRAMVLTRVLDDQPELMRLLARRGYLKTLGYPANKLKLGFSNFDEYLKSLDLFSPNSRKAVRREINKNRREGVVVEEVQDLGGIESRLHDLLDRNFLKHNKKVIPFRRDFLSALKANLGHEAVIYSARKDGEVIGTAVLFRKNDFGYIPLVGVDEEAAGRDFTYFNLAYYKPIRDAIEWKMREFNFGIAMYDIKRRRGCSIQNTYVFYKPFSLVKRTLMRPFVSFHAAWWKRKIDSIRNRRRNMEAE
jgi:predicted N-acyltransferase